MQCVFKQIEYFTTISMNNFKQRIIIVLFKNKNNRITFYTDAGNRLGTYLQYTYVGRYTRMSGEML